MEITEQAIHLLAKMATEVQARFTNFSDLAHGWEHVHRVYHLALHLAEQEHADSLIVGMAALLHDLGRTTRGTTRSHAERSAELAKSYDLPNETQHAILHAILAHSYRDGVEPATLEARVLYDADRLDSLGASGVMRWAMTAKHGRWPEIKTYHPDDPFALWRVPDGQHYLLDRFFTKLLKLHYLLPGVMLPPVRECRVCHTGQGCARINLAPHHRNRTQHSLDAACSG